MGSQESLKAFVSEPQCVWKSVVGQEIGGPQAEQLEFVPCEQIIQNSRSDRGVEPCPYKR